MVYTDSKNYMEITKVTFLSFFSDSFFLASVVGGRLTLTPYDSVSLSYFSEMNSSTTYFNYYSEHKSMSEFMLSLLFRKLINS